MDENKDALDVYLMIQNQLIIAGMNGVILDVDFNAIKFILDLYDIANKKIIFEKVIKVARHFINEDNKKK